MFEEIDNLNVNKGLSFNNKANETVVNTKMWDKNSKIWDILKCAIDICMIVDIICLRFFKNSSCI